MFCCSQHQYVTIIISPSRIEKLQVVIRSTHDLSGALSTTGKRHTNQARAIKIAVSSALIVIPAASDREWHTLQCCTAGSGPPAAWHAQRAVFNNVPCACNSCIAQMLSRCDIERHEKGVVTLPSQGLQNVLYPHCVMT
jgi:hypothetical protein